MMPIRALRFRCSLNSGAFLSRNFLAVSSSLSGMVVKKIIASLPRELSTNLVKVMSD